MSAYSQQLTFRADDVLALFRGSRPLSEGANSGPDQLRKVVLPPWKTDRGAMPHLCRRGHQSSNNSSSSQGMALVGAGSTRIGSYTPEPSHAVQRRRPMAKHLPPGKSVAEHLTPPPAAELPGERHSMICFSDGTQSSFTLVASTCKAPN